MIFFQFYNFLLYMSTLLLTCLLSFKFWLILFPPFVSWSFFMNCISLFCYYFLLCKNILYVILYFNADNYSKIFVGLIMLFIISVDLLMIFYILMWLWFFIINSYLVEFFLRQFFDSCFDGHFQRVFAFNTYMYIGPLPLSTNLHWILSFKKKNSL